MPMKRSQILQTLHLERRPLACLAALGLVLQVMVVSLTLALAPSAMADGLGMLCQPSALEEGSQPRATHDPANCICGPVCGHTGKITATATTSQPSEPPRVFGFVSWAEDHSSPSAFQHLAGAGIRGPPAFVNV
ncbi:hypothetical protein GCM10011316_24420 [Roseibium aquae]|uniref:Uncharacterized protein n=2 Tax=Roseibium aquae TaxID=1323746 RepID=A0A916X2C3_9HYPH|nr:hypothetical protein GCM10011316_24420 [Roseibium aquae]